MNWKNQSSLTLTLKLKNSFSINLYARTTLKKKSFSTRLWARRSSKLYFITKDPEMAGTASTSTNLVMD